MIKSIKCKHSSKKMNKRSISNLIENEENSKRLTLESTFILKFSFMMDPLLKHLDELDILVLSLCNSYLWKLLRPYLEKHKHIRNEPSEDAAKNGHFKLAYWLGNKKLSGYFDCVEVFTMNLEKIHKSQEISYEEKKFQGKIIETIIRCNCNSDIYSTLFEYCVSNGNNYIMNWILSDKTPKLKSLGNLGKNADYKTIDILRKKEYKIQDYVNVNRVYQQALENFDYSLLRTLKQSIPWRPYNFVYAIKNKCDIYELVWLFENGYGFDEYSCKQAAKNGDLITLQWLREKGCLWDKETTAIAAKKGHLKVLKWAIKNGCPVGTTACNNAAMGNRLDILKFLIRKKCQLSGITFLNAMTFGSLEMLKWLKENGCPIPKSNNIRIKIFNLEDCEKLKWMIEEKLIKIRENICLCCAFDLKAEKYILDNGCDECDEECCIVIGLSDISFEFMELLFVNGAEWNDCLMNRILSKRKTNILEWIKWSMKHNCPKSEDHFSVYVASIGDMETLKFLKENDFEFSVNTFIAAVKFGDLEILKWLKENNCPFDKTVCVRAVKNRSIDILKWLRSNGCPWNEQVCSTAAERGYFEILKWSRENGCSWTKDTTWNAFYGKNWQCFIWSLRNNCPVDSNTIEQAKKIGFNMTKLVPNYSDILLYD